MFDCDIRVMALEVVTGNVGADLDVAFVESRFVDAAFVSSRFVSVALLSEVSTEPGCRETVSVMATFAEARLSKLLGDCNMGTAVVDEPSLLDTLPGENGRDAVAVESSIRFSAWSTLISRGLGTGWAVVRV